MTKSIDRRKALTSITSAMLAPAALLPATALALASPATPDNGDHEILALLNEWKALQAKYVAGYKVADQAHNSAKAETPPEPCVNELHYIEQRLAKLEWQRQIHDAVSKPKDPKQISLNRARANSAKLECEQLTKEQRIWQSKRDDWSSDKSAILAKWNSHALYLKADDIGMERYRVEQRIFDTPAQSVTGLLIKFAVWDRMYWEADEVEPHNEKLYAMRAELTKFGVSL